MDCGDGQGDIKHILTFNNPMISIRFRRPESFLRSTVRTKPRFELRSLNQTDLNVGVSIVRLANDANSAILAATPFAAKVWCGAPG